jgi:hypothetical protein
MLFMDVYKHYIFKILYLNIPHHLDHKKSIVAKQLTSFFAPKQQKTAVFGQSIKNYHNTY